ncbi:MAG TPA: hypothetical protein DCQ26_13395 [Marinilabiliales bacterium]|nr:MAG: hypothetical protein A2W96_15935 [Bacteroidetes bacterium GWD2_40_43]OFX89657.1 MAG: hypothetical protein A2W97_13065 [Bacteroidetes bacterium GWE2_40_63]OFY24175.1 MAG: hypothetical protein A2W88_14500 [Bacteroidetes bacterium GWF2_40_13]OFZ26367.1 MAG: hypothetical protein A2437_03415 [Bacteroidetes bacterium RIFOXYC2_FULL_40_12]HAM99598.1 hypothetical protein [Marinilabiliales bacterium]
MFGYSLILDDNKKSLILLIGVVLYFLKSIFNYLGSFSYFILLFGILINLSNLNISLGKIFVKYFKTILIVIILFFFSSLCYIDSVYIIKELFRLVVFIMIVVFITANISFNIDNIIKRQFTIFIISSIFIVGFANLIKLVQNENVLIFLKQELKISNSFSFIDDQNIYALYMLIALILSISQVKEWKSSLFFNLINLVFIINILLSGSRRAIFVLPIIGIVYVYLSIKRKLFFNIIVLCFISIITGLIVAESVKLLERKDLAFYNKVEERYSSVVGESNLRKFGFIADYVRNINYTDENLIHNGDIRKGLKYWRNWSDDAELTIYKENTKKYLHLKRTQGNGGDWQLVYNGPDIVFYANHEYTLTFDVRINNGDSDSFQVGWWIKDGDFPLEQNLYLRKEFISRNDGFLTCKVEFSFQQNHVEPLGFIHSLKDGTDLLIRNIQLLDNDNSQKLSPYLYVYRMEKDIVGAIDKINPPLIKSSYNSQDSENKFLQLDDSRSRRWQYALELWQTKYQWYHKLFGHGFDYLEWYGEKFFNDPRRYDYPHNPIISSFLYSGFVGGLFYIYFLVMVFYYYWKYRKHHMVFFLMYLVTFFFMMFSGNSHFSVPIFTFLSLIPFLTRYYIKSGKLINEKNAISGNSNNSYIQ